MRGDRQQGEILTLREAAELVGVRPATLRQAIHRKALNARKSGGVWLVRRADLAHYRNSRWHTSRGVV